MSENISGSIDIAAPAEKVYAMISDLPRMGEWSPENKGGHWKGGATKAAPGAKFKGNNQNGKKKWKIGTVVISEANEPKSIEWYLSAPPMKGATWRYDIEPTTNGCRVTETWIDTRSAPLKPDFVGKLVTGVADRKAFTKENIEPTLANLKKAAEG
jgi:hypothetical protein